MRVRRAFEWAHNRLSDVADVKSCKSLLGRVIKVHDAIFAKRRCPLPSPEPASCSTARETGGADASDADQLDPNHENQNTRKNKSTDRRGSKTNNKKRRHRK